MSLVSSACSPKAKASAPDSRHSGQDRGQWLRQRLHPCLRHRGIEGQPSRRHLGIDAAEVARRVPLVMSGSTEGGFVSTFRGVWRTTGRGAYSPKWPLSRRYRIHSRFPTRGDRARDDGDRGRRGRAACHCRCTDRRAERRTHFVQNQMPASDERARHRCCRARPDRRHRRYVCFHGVLARGRSARDRPGLGRSRARAHHKWVSICVDFALWVSGPCQHIGGHRVDRCEIIVLGNSAAWTGNSIIAHGVMTDAHPIDLSSVLGVLRELGFAPSGQLEAGKRARVCVSYWQKPRALSERPHSRRTPYRTRRQRHQRDPPCPRLGGWRAGGRLRTH